MKSLGLIGQYRWANLISISYLSGSEHNSLRPIKKGPVLRRWRGQRLQCMYNTRHKAIEQQQLAYQPQQAEVVAIIELFKKKIVRFIAVVDGPLQRG